LGAFLSVDEFEFHDKKSTLWGWPRMNPIRFRDPLGRDDNSDCHVACWVAIAACVSLGYTAPACYAIALACYQFCDEQYPPRNPFGPKCK